MTEPRSRNPSPAAIAIAASLGLHLAGVLLLPIFAPTPHAHRRRQAVHELELAEPLPRPGPGAVARAEDSPILLLPQLGDPAGRSARGAVESVQTPIDLPGARGAGEPSPRPDGARVGEDLDDLRFAPYNHPSKDLRERSSAHGAATTPRRSGVAVAGQRARSAEPGPREPPPYLRTALDEPGSSASRPDPTPGTRPRPEPERLSRIPLDGEVVSPRATSAELPGHGRLASSQRFPDRIDAARPGGKGQGFGSGRGATASRRGSPDGFEHGAPLWLTSGDRRYLDYFRRIYRKVQPLWVFPKQLEVVYEQGEVIVQFAILADGTVKNVRVHKSSGYRQFDANVVAAIEKAAPFGPIPRGLGRRIEILAPFEFANPMVR